MQPLHYVGDHVLFYHKRQIDLGSSLRNHADFDVGQFTEDARRDAGSVAQILADQADDGLASLIFYVRQFGQVRGQRRNRFVRVHGERNAYFRSGDHVHGHPMPVESGKRSN